MTKRTGIEITAAVVVLLGALIAGKTYVDQVRDQEYAKATIEAQKQIIDQVKGVIADRDAKTAELVKTFQQMQQSVKTPTQVVQALPKVIDLPAPVRYADALPNAPSAAKAGDLIIPQADAVPLFNRLAACKESEALLNSCTADKKDLGTQIAATEKQRDAAVTAMKGGGFLVRLKRNAKYVAIGIGVGAATVAVARH